MPKLALRASGTQGVWFSVISRNLAKWKADPQDTHGRSFVDDEYASGCFLVVLSRLMQGLEPDLPVPRKLHIKFKASAEPLHVIMQSA